MLQLLLLLLWQIRHLVCIIDLVLILLDWLGEASIANALRGLTIAVRLVNDFISGAIVFVMTSTIE